MRELAAIEPRYRDQIRGCISGLTPWPIYMFGPSGLGKTSAALCVLDHCGKGQSKGDQSLELTPWFAGFIDVRSIAGIRINCDGGKLMWSGEDRQETARWSTLMAVIGRQPVTVFDEIGVGKEAGDFRLDVLIEVLDQRANHPVKPFIVTSNIPPSQIPQIYDDRVADRILCGTVIKFDGDTRRRS